MSACRGSLSSRSSLLLLADVLGEQGPDQRRHVPARRFLLRGFPLGVGHPDLVTAGLAFAVWVEPSCHDSRC